MTRFRRALTAGVIAVLTSTLAACGSSTGSDGTIRVAVGVDPSYAPLYLAEEAGLFDEAGVDVELILTEGGPAPTEAVAAGTAQISANADSTVLPLLAQRPSLRALAVYQESSSYLKVVLAPDVAAPQDIKRMVTIPGLGLLATVRYLEASGVPRESVELVTSAPPEFPSLLGTGQVDGYILFDPWVTRGVDQGGRVAGTIGDFGVRYAQWLLADEQWLAANEDTAAKVVGAVARAAEMIAADPASGAEATQAQARVPAEQAAAVLPEITFGVRDFTEADMGFARDMVGFFRAEGLLEQEPDLDTAIMRGWLPAHVAR